MGTRQLCHEELSWERSYSVLERIIFGDKILSTDPSMSCRRIPAMFKDRSGFIVQPSSLPILTPLFHSYRSQYSSQSTILVLLYPID